jgi:O-antigen ligase
VSFLARRHTIGRFALWLAVLVPAQSILWTDVALSCKLLVVGFALCAARWPAPTLTALVVLLPFAHLLAVRVWTAPTLRLTEALVLAFLAAALRPWRPPAVPGDRPLAALATGFAAVVLGAVAVQYALERAWQDNWLPFVASSLRYLSTDYLTAETDPRPFVEGLAFVPAAALLLEGVLLVIVVRRACLTHPGLSGRLMRAVIAAAAGAAAMSWVSVIQTAAATGVEWSDVVASTRIAVAIPSLGSSGAYFAFAALLTFGLASARGRWHGVGWGAVAVLIGTACWLTKTRSAIIALIAMTATILTSRLLVHRRFVLVASLAAAIMLGGAVLVLEPIGLVRDKAAESLYLRKVLAEGTVRMIAENPWFGFGFQQFKLRYHEFRTELPWYLEDDPHNQFLGVAVELGLVGLAVLLGFLGSACRPLVAALRVNAGNRELVGLAAALVGFIATWVSHQPLTAPASAFSFWTALGVASAASGPVVSRPSQARVIAAVMIVVAVVIGSLPARVATAINSIDFTKVYYGFHDWETDGAGTRFRWTTGHSTLFLPSTMQLVDLPIAASFAAANRTLVIITIDGEPAGRLELTDEAWHPVRLAAPATAASTWRIDLYVTPAWVPSRIGRNPDDSRTLGVRVGEVEPRR